MIAMLVKVGGGGGIGAVTAKVAVPDLPLKVALMALLPAVKPMARPVVPVMLATAGVAEIHTELVLTLREVPSE